MFKLLENIFINKKYPKEIMNNEKRSAYGILSSIFGIVCNIILCSIKIISGVIFASISLVADGINNLSDGASSITSLIGFKLAQTPPDDEHPYGHERIEYISALFVSIFIIIVGILLGKSSIEKLISKEEMDLSKFYLLIGILGVSILIKMWMGLVYLNVSKKINSLTIKATSQDSFNDCITTFAILISLIISKLTSFNLDAYLGLAVAIFILINGIKLCFETISPLLGEAPSEEYVKKMISKILSYDGILGVHDLVMHNYGPDKYFATIHCEVDSKVDVMISHEVIDQIERDIRSDFNIELTIHLDPIDTSDDFTNELKNILENIINLNEKMPENQNVNVVELRKICHAFMKS